MYYIYTVQAPDAAQGSRFHWRKAEVSGTYIYICVYAYFCVHVFIHFCIHVCIYLCISIDR